MLCVCSRCTVFGETEDEHVQVRICICNLLSEDSLMANREKLD
jgi:hypothetical protein